MKPSRATGAALFVWRVKDNSLIGLIFSDGVEGNRQQMQLNKDDIAFVSFER